MQIAILLVPLQTALAPLMDRLQLKHSIEATALIEASRKVVFLSALWLPASLQGQRTFERGGGGGGHLAEGKGSREEGRARQRHGRAGRTVGTERVGGGKRGSEGVGERGCMGRKKGAQSTGWGRWAEGQGGGERWGSGGVGGAAAVWACLGALKRFLFKKIGLAARVEGPAWLGSGAACGRSSALERRRVAGVGWRGQRGLGSPGEACGRVGEWGNERFLLRGWAARVWAWKKEVGLAGVRKGQEACGRVGGTVGAARVWARVGALFDFF